jgi:hypothetical protein
MPDFMFGKASILIILLFFHKLKSTFFIWFELTLRFHAALSSAAPSSNPALYFISLATFTTRSCATWSELQYRGIKRR